MTVRTANTSGGTSVSAMTTGMDIRTGERRLSASSIVVFVADLLGTRRSHFRSVSMRRLGRRAARIAAHDHDVAPVWVYARHIGPGQGYRQRSRLPRRTSTGDEAMTFFVD